MLGGPEALHASAVDTKAFQGLRKVAGATDPVRLVLAYCLGSGGLRLTAAWAGAVGFADISDPGRLRQCGDRPTPLIGQKLAAGMPAPARGWRIRLIDATSVPKAGAAARRGNGVWRSHAALDLPAERFGAGQLTDESAAERLDRIADGAHPQPDAIAAVCEASADAVVRTGRRCARWQDSAGEPLKRLNILRAAATTGWIDRPIRVARPHTPPLALRLVALRKSDPALAEAHRKARRAAQCDGYQPAPATLLAADWVMRLTSLRPDEDDTAAVLQLYRLRWRIELAFKRLKSVVGLHGPPGQPRPPSFARPAAAKPQSTATSTNHHDKTDNIKTSPSYVSADAPSLG